MNNSRIRIPKVEPSEWKKAEVKALLLYSGGLDSILAAKILENQGINVTALTFTSYFFGAKQAKESLPRRSAGARENSMKLRVENFSDAHFEIVKKPRFGRGAGMNPCIDCHLLMLEFAKKIAERENFDIIATGEVLGQRPMSQNIEALKLIEREAGLVGKILRPLSAKVLPETEYEKTGIVKREDLPAISGRSRKEQIALAKKLGVKYFPAPAGGCILTDKEYSKKLRELFAKVKNIKESDLALLRIGRHFWTDDVRIILGRNHGENIFLENMKEKDDALIVPDHPGPSALVRGKRDPKAIEEAKEKIKKYSKKKK